MSDSKLWSVFRPDGIRPDALSRWIHAISASSNEPIWLEIALSNITVPCEPTGDREPDTLFGHLVMSLGSFSRLAPAVGFEPTTHGLTVRVFNDLTPSHSIQIDISCVKSCIKPVVSNVPMLVYSSHAIQRNLEVCGPPADPQDLEARNADTERPPIKEATSTGNGPP